MNKKVLIKKVTDLLAENNYRKPVSTRKTILHISDDDGNHSDFTIKKTNTGLLLTKRDVEAVVEAIAAVIEDGVKHGDEVYFHGLGGIGLKMRAARQTRHPETGEIVNIAAHYVPTFYAGNRLRMAAKIYEMSLNDRGDKGNGDRS